MLTNRAANVARPAAATRLVFGIGSLLFLVQAALYIGAPAVESLFLARFGADALPLMYIVVGLTVPCAVLSMSVAVARLRRRVLYRVVPAALAAALLLSRLVLIAPPFWFYPVLFVLMNLTFTLGAFFTWGIAGALCSSRDAKRLFPRFAAGGILGGAAGGLVTPILVAAVGPENLVLLWGLLLTAATGISVRLTRLIPERSRRVRHAGGTFSAVQRGWQAVSRSRLLPLYAVTAAFFVASYYLLLYAFSRLAVDRFADEQSLTAFFGLFQGVATVTGLALALFVSRKAYARFGFVGSLLVYGVVFVSGFALTALVPLFTPVVVFRYVQVALYLGVAAPAYQAVFNAIPGSGREQARLLVDGVICQAGVVTAGIAILLLKPYGVLRVHFLTGAFFAIASVVLAAVCRPRYREQVIAALRSGGAGLFDTGRWLMRPAADPRAFDTVRAALADTDVFTRRTAAFVMARLDDDRSSQALVGALADSDAEVRRIALEALGDAESPIALDQLHPLLQDADPRVRRAAILAAGRALRTAEQAREAIESLIEDPDVEVSAAAEAILYGFNGAEGRLNRLLDAGDRRSMTVALEAWRLMPSAAPLMQIITLLEHPDSAVADACFRLLQAVGRPASDALLDLLDRQDRFEPVRVEKALELLSEMDAAVDAERLSRLCDRSLSQLERYRECRALLLREGRELPYTLTAISDRLQAVARIAVWARMLEAGAWDRLALEGLSSCDPEIRGYAWEAVEALKGRKRIASALAILENADARIEDRSSIASAAETESNSLTRVIDVVLSDDDVWITACLLIELHDLLDRDKIVRWSFCSCALVRDAAVRVSRGGEIMHTLPTVSLVERIVFLRRATIFAGLSPLALESVAAACEEAAYAGGELLDEQGAVGECLFLIVEGHVRIVREADRRQIALRGPGEAIGEMAFLSNRPRAATMVAADNVRALILSHRAFEQVLRRSPEVSLAVMRVLCERLEEAETRTSTEGKHEQQG